ncbi:MAG: hypothetical protein IJQ42_08165 [Oscillospiraceae bacterium]|nr:hypothetical protein [Oscillospiraceae bacterium]
MAIERSFFLEIVKDAYSAYYSIVDDAQAPDLPLAFRADYSSRDEQYFFVKSANIWGNEKNEYAYVFSAPEIDPATARKCLDWALQDMLPRVKPHKEHQYTNCKAVFITDTLSDETAQTVKKSKFSKSYGFLSTQGYTELIAAAVDLSTEAVVTNRVGHGLEDFFRKLFALRHEEA